MLHCIITFFLLLFAPFIECIDIENSTYQRKHSVFQWQVRLTNTVKPLYYDLLIHPNLTFFNFTGSVQIQLEVQQDTEHIVLHSKNLHMSKAVVLVQGHAHILHIHENEAFEQIALSSQSFTFTKGIHVIHLDFSANLSDSFHGFYKGSYITRSGEVRWELFPFFSRIFFHFFKCFQFFCLLKCIIINK